MTGQTMGHRECPVGACSMHTLRRLAACYTHWWTTFRDPLLDRCPSSFS